MKEYRLNVELVSQEDYENACWVACTIMIINYLHGTTYRLEDFGDTLETFDMNLEEMDSAVGYLMSYEAKFGNGDEENFYVYDQTIGTKQEIYNDIVNNHRPILCLIGDEIPDYSQEESMFPTKANYIGGHWVVIVGVQVDDYDRVTHLVVANPEKEEFQLIRYDEYYYDNADSGLYWENATPIKVPIDDPTPEPKLLVLN